MVNAAGQTTTYTYDANGNQTSVQDYLGNTTTKEYDGINRLVEVKDPLGNIVQRILYNDADAQTSSFDALYIETKFLYNRNLRQTGTIDAEGNTSSVTYDTRGNVRTKTDGNNNITAYEYDGENRLTCVTDPMGNKTLYSYDSVGNLASQTDGNGNTTTFTYNARNLVTAKIDPAGNGDPRRTESYTYYANCLMTTKTDRNGVTTIYAYDIFGRKTSEDAGGEIQTYSYDNNGNLTEMTDSTGTTIRKYDELNRNIEKTVPGIGPSKYDYDIESEVAGQHCERTTDPKGNVTLKTYDQAGRLTAVTVGEETTRYDYQPNGNRSKVTYPDGTTETYTYDSDNRVTSLINEKSGGTGYSSSVISSYSYTYDGAGNQLTKTEAKGTTSYTYDSLNRLESVTEPEGKVTTYTYDGAGNRKAEKVQFGLTGSDTLYNYDNRNRLISTISMGGAYTRFIYDNNGNLVSKTSGILEPIILGDKLTAADLPSFGLIIKRESENGTGTGDITLYTFDKYNRMTGTKFANSSSTYLYNAQGYRTSKTVNGTTTKYLYEGDKVVLETDGNNEQTAFMAYGSNLLYRSVAVEGAPTEEGVAEETPAEGEAPAGEDTAVESVTAQSYYYLYNAHGDVTSLIEAEGNIAATYDYDAFGNILDTTGAADNCIRYAGYQYDEESGLYYLNARYYDSVTARFISEDSYRGQANDPLSLNMYTYCSNNPIIYTDPTGHAMASVHDSDTYKIALANFKKYIDDEYKKMDIYKRYKDGRVIKIKGKWQKDTNKVKARDTWRDDQYTKAEEMAEALASGDIYVDDEKTILHNTSDKKTEKDYDYRYYHAFNVRSETVNKKGEIVISDIKGKRGEAVKDIIGQSMSAADYYMTGKGKEPTLEIKLNHATYNFTSTTVTKTEKGKVGKAESFEFGNDYTNTEKALFVSGMGLHVLQDSYFHVTENHTGPSTGYSDNNNYDYVDGKWTKKYVEEFTIDGIDFKGGQRYQAALEATDQWVDDFVKKYGYQMFGF